MKTLPVCHLAILRVCDLVKGWRKLTWPFQWQSAKWPPSIVESSWVTLDHRNHMFFGDSPTWKIPATQVFGHLFLKQPNLYTPPENHGKQRFSSFLSEVSWGCGRNMWWCFSLCGTGSDDSLGDIFIKKTGTWHFLVRRFKHFLFSHRNLGNRFHFDEHIFHMGWFNHPSYVKRLWMEGVPQPDPERGRKRSPWLLTTYTTYYLVAKMVVSK